MVFCFSSPFFVNLTLIFSTQLLALVAGSSSSDRGRGCDLCQVCGAPPASLGQSSFRDCCLAPAASKPRQPEHARTDLPRFCTFHQFQSILIDSGETRLVSRVYINQSTTTCIAQPVDEHQGNGPHLPQECDRAHLQAASAVVYYRLDLYCVRRWNLPPGLEDS